MCKIRLIKKPQSPHIWALMGTNGIFSDLLSIYREIYLDMLKYFCGANAFLYLHLNIFYKPENICNKLIYIIFNIIGLL
jgi:hypothetical protein